MTENKKRFRIEFTVDAEGWSDDFIKDSAIQELTCMVPYPEDITFSEVGSPWHTDTPTEEGDYLCKIKSKDGFRYVVLEWSDGWKICGCPVFKVFAEDEAIIEWQKIEENEDGHID